MYNVYLSEQHPKSAMSTVLTLQNLIDRTFKTEANKFAISGAKFKIGDPILAKFSGYCPWPSRLEGFTKNGRRIRCFFYGTHNTGSVDLNQAIPFRNSFEIIRLINLRNTRDFAKGVREIEIENGVPEELSSLREVGTIL